MGTVAGSAGAGAELVATVGATETVVPVEMLAAAGCLTAF